MNEHSQTQLSSRQRANRAEQTEAVRIVPTEAEIVSLRDALNRSQDAHREILDVVHGFTRSMTDGEKFRAISEIAARATQP